MGYRTLIATGVLAAAGLGLAGGALAAPQVTAVDAVKTGRAKLSVGVTTLRGTSAEAPRISVAVKRRIARVRVTDWDSALPADATVEGFARFKRVRSTVGETLTVRVRACDTTCATTTHTVTVADDGNPNTPTTSGSPRSGADDGDHRSIAPLPVGSVTAAQASATAIAAVGPGSIVREVERTRGGRAAWEVKVTRADGVRFEVKIAANGDVVSVERDS